MSNNNVTQILEQRGNRYGTFQDNAFTSQSLKDIMRNTPNYNLGVLEMYHIEALEMIFHKIARILNGDPNYDDSWVDIAGYAQLVVDALRSGAQTDGE